MSLPPPVSTLFPYTTLFRSTGKAECQAPDVALRGNRPAEVGQAGGAGVEPEQVSVRRRSEEHTSELQSRENLVCRLLLEKRKTHPGPRSDHGAPSDARV